jgi:hypothetical protein
MRAQAVRAQAVRAQAVRAQAVRAGAARDTATLKVLDSKRCGAAPRTRRAHKIRCVEGEEMVFQADRLLQRNRREPSSECAELGFALFPND